MSIYSQYVEGLVKLIENGKPDPLKEVISARLKGKRSPVQGLVSPPLSRDEPDENAVFYYVYEKFEAEKNESALTEMRRVVLELLMDAFSTREELPVIDALGQMAGFFQVKEYSHLAEQLRQQLWGYMCTKLGKPPTYKPLTRMMELDREDLEYAWRALDLWLTVTPPLPPDRDAHYYSDLIKLFENSLEVLLPTILNFHLLLLIFRAIIKIKPYYAGRCIFLEMCRKVADLDRVNSDNVYLHGWMALCRELGVLFKYDETPGKKWREEFKKGILDIEENVESEPLFRDSLQRMDGLDLEIKVTFEKEFITPIEIPISEYNEIITPVEISLSEHYGRVYQ